MRAGDRVAALLTIALGAAVVAATRSFPDAPGQPVGPGAFPAAVGIALVASGALLLLKGLRKASSPVEPPQWTASSRLALNLVAALASVVFYALALDSLGFLITAALLLAVLFGTFGVPRRRILPLAVAVTLAIHFVFYALLRVPLPWGVLEGVAW